KDMDIHLICQLTHTLKMNLFWSFMKRLSKKLSITLSLMLSLHKTVQMPTHLTHSPIYVHQWQFMKEFHYSPMSLPMNIVMVNGLLLVEEAMIFGGLFREHGPRFGV